MPKRVLTLTEARQIALAAQGLDRRRTRSVLDTLHRLRSIQLDTISVLARSHELVPYARIGAVGREAVESTVWGAGHAFEYWSHAACLLPVESYPLFAFRRREMHDRKARWDIDPRALRNVRAALRANGPQTATQLGGARRTAGWWEWSDVKRAVEYLLATGEVVVMDRHSWKRVYSLAASSIDQGTHPDWVTKHGVYGPTDADCVRALLLDGIRAIGVGTIDDIKDVHRLHGRAGSEARTTNRSLQVQFSELLETGTVVEVEVEGWSVPAYADASQLQRVSKSAASVTAMLSLFDSLVWYRPRLQRLFDVHLRIESYTPKADRKHGYFAMPTLHNGEIIGFVDPSRDGDTLVANRVTAFRDDVEGFALALAEAARWVGKERVRVDTTSSSKKFGAAVQQAANRTLSATSRPATR